MLSINRDEGLAVKSCNTIIRAFGWLQVLGYTAGSLFVYGTNKRSFTLLEKFTTTRHAVYFTKRTGHLKMCYSRIFSLSEHNKYMT